jgi:hypothetical protein
MIKLTCLGCGCEGRVRDLYAGRRVTCKRCRAENTAPDSTSREIDMRDWAMAKSLWAD